jgi:hypothetical protein
MQISFKQCLAQSRKLTTPTAQFQKSYSINYSLLGIDAITEGKVLLEL